MDSKKKNILVAITGASGAIYAKQLLEKLNDLKEKESLEISVIYSKTGKEVAIHEIGYDFVKELNLKTYEDNNFYAPFASGSSPADILVIAPCSMGTLGRIANGFFRQPNYQSCRCSFKRKKKANFINSRNSFKFNSYQKHGANKPKRRNYFSCITFIL